MTLEELKEAIEGFKKEGYEEEEILEIFYLMYADGKMPLEDLRMMTEAMGYEFTEEFEAMSEEDKKQKGLKHIEAAGEGIDYEDVEDAKEFKEGEDDGKDEGEDDDAPKAESETDDKDEDSDDDDKKAARLFGFNK